SRRGWTGLPPPPAGPLHHSVTVPFFWPGSPTEADNTGSTGRSRQDGVDRTELGDLLGRGPARESGPAAARGALVPLLGLQPALEIGLGFFASPAVVLLELPDQDVAVAPDALPLARRQLAPLLADLPFELRPVALQHVLVHLSSSDGSAVVGVVGTESSTGRNSSNARATTLAQRSPSLRASREMRGGNNLQKGAVYT